MTIKLLPVALLVGFALVGCVPAEVCDSDSDSDSDATCDIAVEVFGARYAWTDDALTVAIEHTDATGFYFGLAETAAESDGWFGEDCNPDNCAPVFEGASLTLLSVEDDAEPEIGRTTRFDNDLDGVRDAFDDAGADRLTYVVAVIGGVDDTACYAWGHDPSYYVGCEEITAASDTPPR